MSVCVTDEVFKDKTESGEDSGLHVASALLALLREGSGTTMDPEPQQPRVRPTGVELVKTLDPLPPTTPDPADPVEQSSPASRTVFIKAQKMVPEPAELLQEGLSRSSRPLSPSLSPVSN